MLVTPGPGGLLWLLISMGVHYAVFMLLKRRRNKLILWIGILFNIALPAYFKYSNFALSTVNSLAHTDFPLRSGITLPLGSGV